MSDKITNRMLNISAAGQIALNLDKQDNAQDGKISKSVWESFWKTNDSEGKYKGKQEQDVSNDGISVRDAFKLIMTRIFNAKNANTDNKTADDIGNEWLSGIENHTKIDANTIDALKETETEETTKKAETKSNDKTEAPKYKYNENLVMMSQDEAGNLDSSKAGQLAMNLDAADGKRDGFISADTWRNFIDQIFGDNQRESHYIKNCISLKRAMISINSYADANEKLERWQNLEVNNIKLNAKLKFKDIPGSANFVKQAEAEEEDKPAAKDTAQNNPETDNKQEEDKEQGDTVKQTTTLAQATTSAKAAATSEQKKTTAAPAVQTDDKKQTPPPAPPVAPPAQEETPAQTPPPANTTQAKNNVETDNVDAKATFLHKHPDAKFKTRKINGKEQEYAIYKEDGKTVRALILPDGNADKLITISGGVISPKHFVSESFLKKTIGQTKLPENVSCYFNKKGEIQFYDDVENKIITADEVKQKTKKESSKAK